MLVAAIEWSKLLQVIWVSLLAGIGVTLIFSLVIYGSARAAEARRGGATAIATLFGALTAVTLAAFAAGVIFGVAIILNK